MFFQDWINKEQSNEPSFADTFVEYLQTGQSVTPEELRQKGIGQKGRIKALTTAFYTKENGQTLPEFIRFLVDTEFLTVDEKVSSFVRANLVENGLPVDMI